MPSFTDLDHHSTGKDLFHSKSAVIVNRSDILVGEESRIGSLSPVSRMELQVSGGAFDVSWFAFAPLWNDAAYALATSPDSRLRDGPRAVELARRAAAGSGEGLPNVLDTLAVAYAETGDFALAREAAHRAIALFVNRITGSLSDKQVLKLADLLEGMLVVGRGKAIA